MAGALEIVEIGQNGGAAKEQAAKGHHCCSQPLKVLNSKHGHSLRSALIWHASG
jgi:hypothetical protein